jgi:hypothetical protein
MNRRSFLRGLFAAPAIIAVDRLMPIKPWLPVIYGDGIHDDWAGLQALLNSEDVDIRADRLFLNHPRSPDLGFMSVQTPFSLSRTLVFPSDTFQRNTFVGCSFLKHPRFQSDERIAILRFKPGVFSPRTTLIGATYLEGPIQILRGPVAIHQDHASFGGPGIA